jgi:hypothetical protein
MKSISGEINITSCCVGMGKMGLQITISSFDNREYCVVDLKEAKKISGVINKWILAQKKKR